MENIRLEQLTIESDVHRALEEDIGDGDITAQLISQEQTSVATVITREAAVICGILWFNEVFRQLAADRVTIEWKVHDGDHVQANDLLCTLKGPARLLLTGERTALNFLQFLSGISTRCRSHADLVKGLNVRLRDSRKTIRLGLYDAFLIKENHIAACDGSIVKVIERARAIAASKPIEIEVENLLQLEEALACPIETILLDNMTLEQMKQAVAINRRRVTLEASGGITHSNLRAVAETGVDYIALGTLTKDVKAIDLSMRFQ
jgi:nicotinate-nucleotide pyrophosphorylase (carboxylating)